MKQDKILVWLPSPMGDAILCTPALRALRKHFDTERICFLANKTVREVLSPSDFCDEWLEINRASKFLLPFKLALGRFCSAILFKNSFGSAFITAAANVPMRMGYARDRRSIFLTKKIYPERTEDGRFKPIPMIDYYLAITTHLGCITNDRKMELAVAPQDAEQLSAKLPDILRQDRPLVVLVPGGAFGPSKCWAPERFAETSDRLVKDFNATVAISVAPNKVERNMADRICAAAKEKIFNLAQSPLTIGQLKALISRADLLIANDTGPRHIAIALERKIITLFGPNDPAWTQTGYPDEIQIVGSAECAPCRKPVCSKEKHLCMDSITVEQVCRAAESILSRWKEHAKT